MKTLKKFELTSDVVLTLDYFERSNLNYRGFVGRYSIFLGNSTGSDAVLLFSFDRHFDAKHAFDILCKAFAMCRVRCVRIANSDITPK